MKTKQVIVVRKDLNMRKGKIASQASHASLAAVIMPDNYVINEDLEGLYHFEEDIVSGKVDKRFLITHSVDDELKNWLESSFTKICVYVDSEEDLLDLKEKCTRLNIRHSLIKDNGLTEFNGVSTHTCLAIGPLESSKFEGLTSELKLL